MKAVLINPRLTFQKGDILGSGVPYMPLELAIFASFLKERRNEIKVLDLFGENPRFFSEREEHYLQGVPIENFERDILDFDPDLIFLYAISYMAHQEILDICTYIKKTHPKPVCILENSQAVTGYSLTDVSDGFFQAGADYLICGEPYWNWEEILSYISAEKQTPPPNVLPRSSAIRDIQRQYGDTHSQPYPAWNLFPIRNYWKLPYSHGPKTKTFFPILTSRGCPYPCDFCVVPSTNDKRWRPRPAKDVVDEMLYLKQTYGVSHFQIEDLNPTIQPKRMDELCDLLISERTDIFFYIVSGTKAETVKIEQIERYAKAGCRYISISPETGSTALLRKIGKPFLHEHGLALVKECAARGIRTQACFVIGHPQETELDHDCSKRYLTSLMHAGLDEAAFFIVAPFSGSKLFRDQSVTFSKEGAYISFSPKNRTDFRLIRKRRGEMIRIFTVMKLFRCKALILMIWRSLFTTPQTKIENVPARVAFLAKHIFETKLPWKN